MNAFLLLLAGLFGFGSCAAVAERDAPVAPISSVRDERCTKHSPEVADVDGDGRMDLAFHRDLGDTTDADHSVRVGACLATGAYLETDGVGMGETFLVLDVDGDGADELLPGGTSVMGGGYDVVRYDGRRLVHLPIDLREGEWDVEHEAHVHAWGCDGPGRLVQATVDWARSTARVETITVRGSSVSRSAETRAVPRDLRDRTEYVFSLVQRCGRGASRG